MKLVPREPFSGLLPQIKDLNRFFNNADLTENFSVGSYFKFRSK